MPSAGRLGARRGSEQHGRERPPERKVARLGHAQRARGSLRDDVRFATPEMEEPGVVVGIREGVRMVELGRERNRPAGSLCRAIRVAEQPEEEA